MTMDNSDSASLDTMACISELLEEYMDLFQAPTALPPCWPQDYKINLVSGAQPISAHPYHCTPHKKDGIK